MANYNCVWRTNYFNVKDAEFFRQVMEMAKRTSEDLYIGEDPDGTFMLGGYGCPSFCPGWLDDEKVQDAKELLEKIGMNDVDNEEDDIFFDVLQKCVADDDAILFKEGGAEKLRYVNLSAGIITSKSIEWIDIEKQMTETARKMLNNDSWETKLDY